MDATPAAITAPDWGAGAGVDAPPACADESAEAQLETRGRVTGHVIRLSRASARDPAAHELVGERYRWRGYTTDVVHEHPSSAAFVAYEAGRPVATVTVGIDSQEGLAVESLYPDEVARMRDEGATLCEFTRLAVDRPGDSLELLGLLFHVAYLYARRIHEATHLLAEVNPRHVGFYLQMLGFRIAGPRRVCRRVEAPAVLLALPLDHADAQIALLGGRPGLARGTRSLYPHFFAPREEERVVRRLLVGR